MGVVHTEDGVPVAVGEQNAFQERFGVRIPDEETDAGFQLMEVETALQLRSVAPQCRLRCAVVTFAAAHCL